MDEKHGIGESVVDGLEDLLYSLREAASVLHKRHCHDNRNTVSKDGKATAAFFQRRNGRLRRCGLSL